MNEAYFKGTLMIDLALGHMKDMQAFRFYFLLVRKNVIAYEKKHFVLILSNIRRRLNKLKEI